MLSRSRSDSQQAGFTLAELMVAIAVGAVLLSIGVPSLTRFMKDAAMVSSANDLLFDMHFARDTAIARNRRVVMCPSSSGAACDSADWAAGWIVFVDNDNDGALDGGEPIERVGARLDGLSLQNVPGPGIAGFPNSLTYRPNGRAMGDTVTDNRGVLLMCDDRGAPHARGIFVEPSGRPRVSHLAELGITAPCPDM